LKFLQNFGHALLFYYKILQKSVNVACVAGKSFENVRRRGNYHLVCSPKKCERMAAKPTFKRFVIISPDLALVEMLKTKVTLDKPIFTGFSVLEMSKWLMYNFHYKQMRSMFPNQLRLLFTDTGN